MPRGDPEENTPVVTMSRPGFRRDGNRWGSKRTDVGVPVRNATILRKLFPKAGEPEKETGYTIARARNEDTGAELMLKGPYGPVSDGELVSISKGAWKEDSYGPYFFVIARDHKDPVTREALLGYLRQLPGVGETLAEAIVETFAPADGSFDGARVLELIDADPTRLASVRSTHGRGITADLDELIERWESLRGERRLMLYFGSLGLGDATARRAAKHLGNDCIDALEKNPYLLCEVPGIGFRIADRVGRKRGFGFDDHRRLSYGIEHVLGMSESDGAVCLTREQLLARAPALLAVDGRAPGVALLEQTIDEMLSSGRLAREQDPGDGKERIYSPELYIVETRTYRMLEEMLTAEPRRLPVGFAKPESSPLTDEQWQAVERAFAEKISILTGGPGSGKTTTLRGMIDELERRGQKVLCLAPTGKAAKRMSEQTERPASTIHRKLGFAGLRPPAKLEDDFSNRGSFNDFDVVVIDEASMLDLRVAERVLSHIDADTRLVLVGDPDQLPPVGVGSLLLDLIDSGRAPTTSLTKIFRQAEGSLLVLNAYRIRDGKEPHWTAQEAELAVGHPVADDWCFIESKDADEARELVVSELAKTAKRLGVPETEIFVTGAFHKGACGVHRLNAVLRERANPYGAQIRGGEEAPLYLGDIVMNTVNRYVGSKSDDRHSVMNGDIGKITDWYPDTKTAWVDFGQPEGPQSFSGEELDAIVPAYAATTHKLQGSEAPAIIAPVVAENSYSDRLLTRNLLYTAWTRAKELCVVVGHRATLLEAIGRDGSKRASTLDLRIGAIPPRVKSRAETLLEMERAWRDHAREQGLPLRIRRNRRPPQQETPVEERQPAREPASSATAVRDRIASDGSARRAPPGPHAARRRRLPRSAQ